MIKAGILGVSGYTGQELITWLLKHPKISVTRLFSTSIEGKASQLNSSFFHFNELPDVELYSVDKCNDLDLIFLAVPHTKAMAIVSELRSTNRSIRIVDLSADYRLNSVETYESYYNTQHIDADALNNAVYGLPEKYFDAISSAYLVANPGCYATAMILGLLPLSSSNMINMPIVIDAKSGTSGAGKSLKQSSLFCEVHDTFSAYSTGVHRHTAELIQETGFSNVMFSPHLLPINRGIEAAIYVSSSDYSESQLVDMYDLYYKDHPFVQVLPPTNQPNLNMVKNTNHCVIIPKAIDGWVVVFSLIDNLVKGASGQAIQNANIMFGFDQTTGLI